MQRDWSSISELSISNEMLTELKNMLMTVIDKPAPLKKRKVGKKGRLDYFRFSA